VFQLRYTLPGVLILLGLIALPVDPSGEGVELFSMLVGAGLSVLLFNLLFRWGSRGDDERVKEADARDYYAEHGRWPDDPA
jgi:multisubunit Na+/H+ antiporter MnhB subunit